MDSQNSSTTTEEYLNPDEIKALPFLKKLHALVSVDWIQFINWDPTGTMIGIQTYGLRQYLGSRQSIFFVKDCMQFVACLKICGFAQVPVDDKMMNVDILFKHASFLREHKELLINVGYDKQSLSNEMNKLDKPNILKRSAYCTQSLSDEMKEKEKQPLTDMHPMEDKTSAFYGGVSKSVYDQVFSKVALNFTAAQRNLEVKKWEMQQAGTSGTVLAFPKRIQSSHPGLPGFYAPCSMETIKGLYGDLLEKYKTAATEDENSNNITEVLQKTPPTRFVELPPQEPKAAAKQHIDKSFADKNKKQVIRLKVTLPPQTPKSVNKLDIDKHFAKAGSSGEEDLPLGELIKGKMKLDESEKVNIIKKKLRESKKKLLGSKKTQKIMKFNHGKHIKLDDMNVMSLNVSEIENDDSSISWEMDPDSEKNKEKKDMMLEQQEGEKPDPIQSFDDFLKEINDAWDKLEL